MNKRDELQYWLLTAGRHAGSFQDLLEEYARRLLEIVIPADRIFIATTTLHPQASAFHFKWERSQDGKQDDKYAEYEVAYPTIKKTNVFDWDSVGGMPPFAQLRLERVPQVRIRVEAGDKIPADCMWMTEGKYTDFIALPDNNGKNGTYVAGYSWSTKIQGGFTPDHIEYFNNHMPALSTVVRLLAQDKITKTLLVTYLGQGPGSRVHCGSIHRGDGVTMRSVIWFSDVRNFTAMSNRLPQMTVIQIINTVFEVSESVIRKHGGEVLKFMGDGLSKFLKHTLSLTKFLRLLAHWNIWCIVAVFSEQSVFSNNNDLGFCRDQLSEHERRSLSCQQARIAAQELQERLKMLRSSKTDTPSDGAPRDIVQEVQITIVDENFSSGISLVRGDRVPMIGIGLHYGDCTYGNIGAPCRLDFTVIGPSVNLASRVESLCAKLGADVLASAEFVEYDGADTGVSEILWKNRGTHSVKGFTEPIAVFQLHPL